MNQHKKHLNLDFGKVAVLLGGRSSEREISLKTGTAVHEALRLSGVDAHLFDTAEHELTELLAGGFTRAFIALHGRGGEDGTIQGALETLGIPYTGSGVLGSALAMDKVRSKQVWIAAEIPTPEFIEIRCRDDLDGIISRLGLPVIIKPVNEGSSVGATKVKHEDELEAAWHKARETDERVMAERWITGDEYTATILGNEVYPLIRLETPREFYDFEAKYRDNTTQYMCPCGLEPEQESHYGKLVLAAFEALGARGWGRVDFMVDTAGQAWLIELNTIPGMTSHSLVPMSAREAGLSFEELVVLILGTSMEPATEVSV